MATLKTMKIQYSCHVYQFPLQPKKKNVNFKPFTIFPPQQTFILKKRKNTMIMKTRMSGTDSLYEQNNCEYCDAKDMFC